MKIAKDTVVTLRYKVAEAGGKLIEESREPMVYLHGGYNNTLPKIEEALEGEELAVGVVGPPAGRGLAALRGRGRHRHVEADRPGLSQRRHDHA